MSKDWKMQLSNSDEALPEVFYVFTNMNHWLTRHNLQFTGGITSGAIGEIAASPELRQKYLEGTINYTQYVPNESADVHAISVYSMNSTSGYRIEYNCELYRRSHDQSKLSPSRMSCIYAFGDYDSCQKVAEAYGWDIDSVKKYKLLSNPLTRVAKVNMEIISLMRTVEMQSTWPQVEQEKIWQHYWSGGADLSVEIPMESGGERKIVSSGVIWEYLIEGRLELLKVES